jgi:hypothetical protein
MKKNTVRVIIPRPPTCINNIITICPNSVHCVRVSATTIPVKHAADVEVNNAPKKPILFPSFDAKGRFKKKAPNIIISKKLNTIARVGAR